MVAYPETKSERPTFKEIYEQFALNVEDLTGDSQRYHAAVILMLENRAVLKEYAKAILSALSLHTGSYYGLDNVAVNLVEDGVNPSETSYILGEIRTEYEAAELGLSGLSARSNQHKTMTAKTERIAALHEALRELTGDEAMELVVQMLDQEAPASTSAS